jgi:dynein heavy chain
LNENTCKESFTYNPKHPINQKKGEDFIYRVQSFETIGAYHGYIKSFPEIDSPEIFGLHPNADLTFRVKEVTALFNTLGETQPKGVSSGL